jgi:hypothetical protein
MTAESSRFDARPSSLKEDRPTLSLHIEELVFHGVAPIDRDRIGEATQRELARLFIRKGVPRSLAGRTAVDLLDGGALQITFTATPEPIGTQLARGIYGALSQGVSERGPGQE